MATYSPTIITSSTPGLAIESNVPGLPYSAIINDLGVSVYEVEELYYKASTIPQLSNPITYNIFDANGDVSAYQILTPISPIQYQPSIVLKPESKKMILDGQSGMRFNMFASQEIQFIFYATRRRNQDYMDKDCVNNYDFVDQVFRKDFYNEKQPE